MNGVNLSWFPDKEGNITMYCIPMQISVPFDFSSRKNGKNGKRSSRGNHDQFLTKTFTSMYVILSILVFFVRFRNSGNLLSFRFISELSVNVRLRVKYKLLQFFGFFDFF